MNRIKELRTEHKMKQSELAKLLCCSPTAISNYEVGYRDLDSATICKLCDIFGCTADYLLCRNSTGGFQLTPEEENIVLAYRRADERSKGMVDLALEPFKQGGSSAKMAGIA